VLSAIAGPASIILLDADSHACIYDGCRLSGAEIIRFRHNDAADPKSGCAVFPPVAEAI
jgi:8-amino-7-oxononanoate synthase